MKKHIVSVLIAISITSIGYSAPPVKTGDLPKVKPASSMPSLADGPGEALIAKSYINADPSLVLGALINLDTKQVVSLESYLKEKATPTISVSGKLLFQDLVEQNIAANASYLSFISLGLSDKKKAEVTLIMNQTVQAKAADLKIDELRQKVIKEGGNIKNFGLIISYTDYLLTASFFKQAEGKADAAGFGANIGGTWFNKQQGLSIERYVVATYAPLTVLVPSLDPTSPKSIQEIIQPSLNKISLEKIRTLNVSE